MDWLLDSVPFLPRHRCGPWPDWLVTVNILANFGIFASYTVISASLALWGWRYRHERCAVMQLTLALFCLFIFSCGVTHLGGVFSFIWPAYRFFTLLDVLCFLVSGPTAVLLSVPKFRQLSLSRRSTDDWNHILADYEAAKVKQAELIELQARQTKVLEEECERLRQIAARGKAAEILHETVAALKVLIQEGHEQQQRASGSETIG